LWPKTNRFNRLSFRIARPGVDCGGSIVAVREQQQVTLQCNVYGAVVGMVHAEILRTVDVGPPVQ